MSKVNSDKKVIEISKSLVEDSTGDTVSIKKKSFRLNIKAKFV